MPSVTAGKKLLRENPSHAALTVHMYSNLSHAVPVLRELGVRVSASRLYNEYRDQVERSHGLPVTSRTVVLWPRVSVSKV